MMLRLLEVASTSRGRILRRSPPRRPIEADVLICRGDEDSGDAEEGEQDQKRTIHPRSSWSRRHHKSRFTGVSGSLETLSSAGELSIEDSQPRVSSSYDVAWRYHQVTPQVRRAQTVMPVELLTSLPPGNTELRVDQRPGPLRRTPRRSPTHRQTAELQPLIEHLREAAQGRDDIRTECAGTIAGGWFASGVRRGEELITAGLLMLAGPSLSIESDPSHGEAGEHVSAGCPRGRAGPSNDTEGRSKKHRESQPHHK
jgi:hypothetical protein